jgi:hypothetical protein
MMNGLELEEIDFSLTNKYVTIPVGDDECIGKQRTGDVDAMLLLKTTRTRTTTTIDLISTTNLLPKESRLYRLSMSVYMQNKKIFQKIFIILTTVRNNSTK